MIRYTPVDEPAHSHTDIEGFIAAYQEAFAGPPYFEHYSHEEVLEEVWNPHLHDGIIILAYDDLQVVGFGCAIPVLKAPADVKKFLIQHENQTFPAELSRTWYMSELGVLESYRRRGIGYQLVKHRMQAISDRGDTHYVFRTAAEGSNSIHLYQKIGAVELPDLQDVSGSEQVVVQGSQSHERVYLYGDLTAALLQLPAPAA